MKTVDLVEEADLDHWSEVWSLGVHLSGGEVIKKSKVRSHKGISMGRSRVIMG